MTAASSLIVGFSWAAGAIVFFRSGLLGEVDMDCLLQVQIHEGLIAQLVLDVLATVLRRQVVEICLHCDAVHAVAHMAWKIRGKGILELENGLEE